VIDLGITEVKVSDIESALADRWRAVAAGTPDAAPARAHALNLIACVDDAGAGRAVSDIVGRLAATHPLRVITIVRDDGMPEDALRSWIGAGCAEQPDAQICSEEIFIAASAQSAEAAASAVEGLLSGDMPVYLWWRGGPPSGNQLFARLVQDADKIIVDSMRFGDNAAALDTLRRIVERHGGNSAIADFNWHRIAPWRATIAACFDDAGVLALLPEFDRCAIEFLSTSPASASPSARALLLSNWMTSRQPPLRGCVRIVPLQGEDNNVGRLESVRFGALRSQAALELERIASPLGVVASARGADGSDVRRSAFPAETLSEAELLHRCIVSALRDPMLEVALREE
jgi:glucose-6-phosphate dehydrogenase assembly protein OpcA